MLWTAFLSLSLLRFATERLLAWTNKRFYEQSERQKLACQRLGWTREAFDKCLHYARDKYWFAWVSSSVEVVVTLSFLYYGGLGWLEGQAQRLAFVLLGTTSEVIVGLCFFGLLGLLSMAFGLGFEIYSTFVVEQKHGFNRQTGVGFVTDKLKGLALGSVIGGAFLSVLLYVIAHLGSNWWIWAWAFIASFQLVMLWIYPSVLAPLFNTFSPLEEGELKEAIYALAHKVEFKAAGISVMDASRRSGHGNAYFTGVMGEKKIVLFDTLLKQLSTAQTVAVMAHELGHFKCNHVRNRMLRGFLFMALLLWGLAQALPYAGFYTALGMQGVSSYGALAVFPMWWGLFGFWLTPLSSLFSRKDEYQADAFAVTHTGSAETLSTALVQLSEENKTMPLVHPWFSGFYYSHPTVFERMDAMQAQAAAQA
ncbi:MAG: M48 family metallopeptidase [Zetaproteobacteria bacterium]|nr:M48 family metallopeptidase [Zetaproteobacteria bacterium]